MEPPLEDQREKHCLYDIVLVMRVCHLVATHFLHRLIERAFSHLGAQGTWIALFTHVKKNIVNVRADNAVGYIQFFT